MRSLSAHVVGLGWLLVAGSLVAAQDQQVDRHDPAAVAQAYVEACRQGDLAAAQSLLSPDDPARKALADAYQNMHEGMRQAGFSMAGVISEMLMIPLELDAASEPAGVEVEGDRATVRLKRSWPVEQTFVLRRAPDGLWHVALYESAKATTGGAVSFLEMQAREAGPQSPNIWESHNRLRELHQGIEEYARDHDGRYPPAGTWMDALEPYLLAPDAFRCPAAPDLEYGYAMNAALGDQPVPQDWEQRRRVPLLFEWPGGGRNASAMAEELGAAKSFREDKAIAILDASGNTRSITEGVSWDEMVEAGALQQQCQSNLQKLAEAARRYARENGGALPGAETWEDDLALYLMGEDVEALLHCPAAPDLARGYALNAQVAGANARELPNHGRLVLFFESDLDVPHAVGSPEQDAPAEGRHIQEWDGSRMNHVVHLNGTVGSESPRTAGGG